MQCVRVLLAANSNVNEMVHGVTALLLAVSNGAAATTRLLLEQMADPDLGETSALEYARSYGFEDIAKLLVDAGASTEIKEQTAEVTIAPGIVCSVKGIFFLCCVQVT